MIGGGAIGLIMVQLAKLAGASAVILSEPVEMRRRIGLEVGASCTVDPINENLNDRIRDITGTEGVDVVIECVGRLAVTRQAFDAAKRGATVLLFSVPQPDAIFGLDLMAVFQKELNIRGSFINPDTLLRAVQLINSGKIQLDSIITHRFPLEKVQDAINMQMSNESIKVLVIP